jgi:hypothetical protein
MTYFKNLSIFETLLLLFSKIYPEMRISHPFHLLLFTMLVALTVQPSAGQKPGRVERLAVSRMEKWISPVPGGSLPEAFRIDSLKIDGDKKEVKIYLPVTASYNPIREDVHASLVRSVKATLGKKFSGYTVDLYSNGFSLGSMVPNYFRSVLPVDSARIVSYKGDRQRLVSRTGAPTADRGLDGRYIALWHSHGYYFDQPLDRWEWQRAKLFAAWRICQLWHMLCPILPRCSRTRSYCISAEGA